VVQANLVYTMLALVVLMGEMVKVHRKFKETKSCVKTMNKSKLSFHILPIGTWTCCQRIMHWPLPSSNLYMPILKNQCQPILILSLICMSVNMCNSLLRNIIKILISILPTWRVGRTKRSDLYENLHVSFISGEFKVFIEY